MHVPFSFYCPDSNHDATQRLRPAIASALFIPARNGVQPGMMGNVGQVQTKFLTKGQKERFIDWQVRMGRHRRKKQVLKFALGKGYLTQSGLYLNLICANSA